MGERGRSDGVFGGAAEAEQDRLLPMANVGRIMKRMLPCGAKISKEAKETVQESVSEFISFVTGEAAATCLKEKRRTLNGDDICAAMRDLGMDDLAGASRVYLMKYREAEASMAETAIQELDLFRVKPLEEHHLDPLRRDESAPYL